MAGTRNSFFCEIRDLNERGQGVGIIREGGSPSTSLEGMICFVDGALPGEKVTGILTKRSRHYLVLDLDRIIQTSDDRIESDCEYFPACGSCRLRHLSYQAELAYKEKRVRDLLSRQGPIDAGSSVFRPILGMEDPFHYRGKSIFPVGRSANDKNSLTIGQYRFGSHDLVDLCHCKIQSQPALSLVNRIRELASGGTITPYDEGTHQGTLRHLLIRTAFSSRQVMLVFVVNDQEADVMFFSWLPELRESVELQGFTLHSVWINDMKEKGNRVLSSHYRHAEGSRTIEETIRGVTYMISPDSFFQVNPKQAAVLFEEVIKAAKLIPGQRLLDLYCGVGALSLQFAAAMRDQAPPLEVTGIDQVKQAVMDARNNAGINGLDSLTFIEADATRWLKDYSDNGSNPPFDALVADPPRKGLEPQAIEVIKRSGTPRIVYISCNPATLARDLALLSEVYRVESVQPVDMFPRTAHVETVVSMTQEKDNLC
ncbi:MAG TPA: 23S rRNA (uracil(1939)-C(5))-methyltransferase RlmD [Bacillota bacterium]|jgi:23S rRNA (uracil1939-C5)-methyltransferase|nr:23S rRNA (uracil(1939)-C(5))-methyltransferase RlmD [Bacillota bacterium]